MVTGCVIRKCSSVWSPISDTSYHCFPMKNQVMFEKWMKAIPPGYITIPNKNSRICSLHFADDCFTYTLTGKKTLQKDAVPTLFGSETRQEHLTIASNKQNNNGRKENVRDVANLSDDTEIKDEPSPYEDRKIYYANTKGIHKRRMKAIGIQTKPKRTKISPKELHLKKQIILLKKRLSRRESRIKSMTELVKALEKIIMRKNIPSMDIMYSS